MPTQQTASWLVRAAIVEQSIKRAVFSPFDRMQTLCYNAYFRWCGTPRQREAQGFCAILRQILALEQS